MNVAFRLKSVVLPSSTGVRIISWSKNCPNCITASVCVGLVSVAVCMLLCTNKLTSRAVGNFWPENDVLRGVPI